MTVSDNAGIAASPKITSASVKPPTVLVKGFKVVATLERVMEECVFSSRVSPFLPASAISSGKEVDLSEGTF